MSNTPKQRLMNLRAELLFALNEGDESAKPVVLDQNKVGRLSRMDALQQQAMQQAGQTALRKRLADISRALNAIAEDEYGYCEMCGEEIPEQRLAARPEATHCVGCQEKMEGR